MKYKGVKMKVEDRGDRWGIWICPRCNQENETNLEHFDEYDRMLDGCATCQLTGHAIAPHRREDGYRFYPSEEQRKTTDILSEYANAMKEMTFIVETRKGGSIGIETDADEGARRWRALNRQVKHLYRILEAILNER